MESQTQAGPGADGDTGLLNRVKEALPILADLSRSDLLLYVPAGSQEAMVIDQARPHSIYPVYAEDLVGTRVDAREAPWVFRGLATTSMRRGVQSATVRNAPIVREVLPVLGTNGQAVAALSIETNLLAHERHRRRSRAFRWALQRFQEMALRGELANGGELSPFGEHDGIVVVDPLRRIMYVSGIAANLYRRIGYMGSLVSQSVYRIETSDAELVDEALNHGRCIEREQEEHGRIWIRKVIPLYGKRRSWSSFWQRLPQLPAPPGSVPLGVMWTVHDATETRDKERELRAKMAMVQEIHHRVKNNLQAIASLLRLQARRTASPEVEQALRETVSRILSVAVVHEFLSYGSGTVINLREIAQRIVEQMADSTMDPGKSIQFRLGGPSVYLSSQQATVCALVINELLQNAVEHGFAQRSAGTITIDLTDQGDQVGIEIGDDGTGLPSEFDLEQDGGLGLRIVQTLVQGDLRGEFELRGEGGVKAHVAFPKTSLGGERN